MAKLNASTRLALLIRAAKISAEMSDQDAADLVQEMTSPEGSAGNADDYTQPNFLSTQSSMLKAQAITKGAGISDSGAKMFIRKHFRYAETGKIVLEFEDLQVVNDVHNGNGYLFVVQAGDILGFLHYDMRMPKLPAVHGVWLHKALRKKGVGKRLYEWLIGKYKRLRSDINLSEMSIRVWYSLAQRYNVRLIDYDTSHEVPFSWLAGMPTIDGKPMTAYKKHYFIFEARK